jgi:hypothetical protein
MAETCRRVGVCAEEAGLARPSYVHLRRLIQAHRERSAELREILEDVLPRLVLGRWVDPYELAERLGEALRRR